MSSYLYLDSKHLHLEKDKQTAGAPLFPENKMLTELAFIRCLCRTLPLHLLRLKTTLWHPNMLFHLPDISSISQRHPRCSSRFIKPHNWYYLNPKRTESSHWDKVKRMKTRFATLRIFSQYASLQGRQFGGKGNTVSRKRNVGRSLHFKPFYIKE